MSLEDIHNRNRPFGGVHGLIFLGERTILAMIRDENTSSHPGKLDLIGGGRDRKANGKWETAFETFCRESREEAGVRIKRKHIVDALWYPKSDPLDTGVQLIVRLPASADAQVRLGKGEGKRLERLSSIEALLARDDLVPAYRPRIEDCAQRIATVLPLFDTTAPLEAQIA